MTEIVLTSEQYMGTAIGAGMVFLLMGMLVAFFYDRALRAEEEVERLKRWARGEER